jgi:hypothetical protein
MSLIGYYSIRGHTCGDHCWFAREDECKCSCGGKNHGICRAEGSKRPDRTRKLDGAMFVMAEIGNYDALRHMANAENRKDGIFNANGWKFGGSPRPRYEVRGASPSQRKWPELAAFLETSDLCILWKRIETEQ